MAFISLLWQAGLSQVLLRPHQKDIQDWICILSFFLIKVVNTRSFSLLVQVKHSSNWDKVSWSHSRTRGKISSAKQSNICSCCCHWDPTELRKQHDQWARALKQFSTSTEYVLEGKKCMVLRENRFTLKDIGAISCSVQNWTPRDSKWAVLQDRVCFSFLLWLEYSKRIVWTTSCKSPAIFPGILGIGA